MDVLSQVADGMGTFSDTFKTYGWQGAAVLAAFLAARSCYRFMFNEDPRPGDGKCKGPLARALNDHVDQISIMAMGITAIKDCVKQEADNHQEVMRFFTLLDGKIERLFDLAKNDTHYMDGVLAILNLDLQVAEELGVDVSEHRAHFVALSKKRKQAQ